MMRSKSAFYSALIGALALYFTLFLNPSAQATTLPQRISFKHIEEFNTTAFGTVRTLLQDKDGFLWIGSDAGLTRYDGHRFRSFATPTISPSRPTHLYQDRQARLWVSSANGLFWYNPTTETLHPLEDNPNQPIQLSKVTSEQIAEAPSGEILVATLQGLVVINPETLSYSCYTASPYTPNSLPSGHLHSIYTGANQTIWIGSEHGLIQLDWPSKSFTQHTLPSPPSNPDTAQFINVLIPDSKGQLWIGTQLGLVHYNPSTQTGTRYSHQPENPTSLGANVVDSILIDRQGVLWAATDGGGISLMPPNAHHFSHLKPEPGRNDSLNAHAIRTLQEDNNGDLWIGNFGVGISYFDRSTTAISSYSRDLANPNSLSHSNVISALEDAAGNLWLGTDSGGLNYFNRETGQFTHYRKNPSQPHSLTSDTILSLHQAPDGQLWLGTWGGGVNLLKPNSTTFERLPLNENGPSPSASGISSGSQLNSPFVWDITTDKHQHQWIATHNGGLNQYNPSTGQFTYYTSVEDKFTTLSSNLVWTMREDFLGNFWVGTNNGLNRLERNTGMVTRYLLNNQDNNRISPALQAAPHLNGWSIKALFEDRQKRLWIGSDVGLYQFDIRTGASKAFSQAQGLPHNEILAITEDAEGQLWLSTKNGFCRFNPNTYDIKNFTHISGKRIGDMSQNGHLLSRQGEIILGGTTGLRIINPSQIRTNPRPPNPVFTGLNLFTQNSPNINLNHHPEVTLHYQQSLFALEFSALNLREPEKNQYQYQLQGFDKNWIDAGNQTQAKYTNLPAGTYTFKLKASNNDGVWNPNERRLTLIQLPPPWRTAWAYSLYSLLLLGAIGYYLWQQHCKTARDKAYIAQLHQLNQLKDDFLANTSHELRTPLNGIIGLADSLIEGAAGPISPEIQANLRMIASSGKRLSTLINDILDFSRLKNGKINLNCKPIPLRPLAETVITLSRPLIGPKNLDITCLIDEHLPAVMADEHRLQQILFNLVGNAIKFTDSGLITLNAQYAPPNIRITVTDTGIGIPPEKFATIFESFEQIAEHTQRSQGGTGLGLAVTKQLVDLHGGGIGVESTPGQGTCFTITLPSTGQAAPQLLNHQDFISSLNRSLMAPQLNTLAAQTADTEAAQRQAAQHLAQQQAQNAHYRILIVDDEQVNRQVLKNQLRLKGYTYQEAASGPEALNLIAHQGPFHLVLLDVMMPQMSGYEVCREIRQHHNMHQLPIIFLTAKTLITDLVDGFNVGANDFLTKPIAQAELLARVHSQLQQHANATGQAL